MVEQESVWPSVKKLSSAMARMGVESQPAWGSVFWFTLPVGEPQLV